VPLQQLIGGFACDGCDGESYFYSSCYEAAIRAGKLHVALQRLSNLSRLAGKRSVVSRALGNARCPASQYVFYRMKMLHSVALRGNLEAADFVAETLQAASFEHAKFRNRKLEAYAT
jgi:hypothetical protein